ncbi:type IV pilin N-terminal domain-containing protein [Haloquadratum walsbyi]|nr:type IV pilin N-terminal domain-containing protein [Haloquadratum walsbyi]
MISQQTNQGVSSVVGTIIMIVIVFISASITAPVFLDVVLTNSEPINADIGFQSNTDATVTVDIKSLFDIDYVTLSYGSSIKTVKDTPQSIIFTPEPGNITDPLTVIGYRGQDTEVIDRFYFSKTAATLVEMKSSTCDSPGTCSATIHVDGIPIKEVSSGINILIVDESGAVTEYATGDTHTNSQFKTYFIADETRSTNKCGNSCGDEIQQFIETNAEETDDILLIGGGQPGRNIRDPSDGINAELEEFYRDLGGQFSGDLNLEENDSWILVTTKSDSSNSNAQLSYEYIPQFERHTPRGKQSGIGNVTAVYLADLG